MTTADKAGPGLIDARVTVEGFAAVEALQEASKAAGWDCEYRQLEKGRLKATTWFKKAGDIPLICESADRLLEVAATSPESAVVVFVPAPDVNFRINGCRFTGDRILLMPPGCEVNAVAAPPNETLQMHVPQEMFFENVDRMLRPRRRLTVTSATPIIVGRHVDSLRESVRDALRSESTRSGQESQFTLLASLCSVMGQGIEIPANVNKYHRRQRRRAFLRAREYINGSMSEAISMADLCNYAGVSLSTLERLFRRELQQTPTEYLRARRLDAVRRELMRRRDAASIAQIAMKNGFSHMSRFASAYRAQYGVLPSHDR